MSVVAFGGIERVFEEVSRANFDATIMNKSEVLDRCRYFRDVQLWPLADKLDYEAWINNFAEGEEQEIASRILGFFTYFPDTLMNQMLSTVVGKCGYFLKQVRGNWSHEQFKTNCWFSFVPGENLKTTDSGYIFQRKLRDVLKIPEERLVDYKDLCHQLSANYCQNVIMVDDFVGSGQQTDTAWNTPNSYGTLKQIAKKNNHCIIYAPLVVNKLGKELIEENCEGLRLEYVHLLTEECCLFSPNCPCWEGRRDIYEKAMNLILKKSKLLGISDTEEGSETYYQGYCKQGLAIGFEHGIPDACPPFMYWDTENWKPLMNRVYKRTN